MTEYNVSKIYIQYVEDILNRRIASCEAIFLACKRFKEWFKRDDIYFDYEDVDRRIKFVSKMKHWTGVHNGKNFILLPWQQFAFAGIFGWKWKNDGTRVTKNVLIMPVRKTGKTTLMAAIALVMATIDGENGAECDFIANSRAQANLGFNACKNLSESIDPMKMVYQRYRDTIKVPHTKSVIQVLCSDSMTLDGYNSSCTLIDEFHAAKDWELYNVMKSSQGMRLQPLTIVCTTAGFLLDGFPLYEMRKVCVDILKGVKDDDTQFSLIYELDEKDDYTDPKNWIKCCPSLGQTVFKSYIEDQVQAAHNNTALELGIKTKNFNIFCQSVETWIPNDYIKNCMQKVDIEQLKGEYCYGAADLSAVSDLTCTSIMFPPNESREYYPDKYIFKTLIYIPASALDESINKQTYKNWINRKEAILTDGNVVDYDQILKDQMDIMESNPYSLFTYDAWNATQWAINATQAGLPLEPFSQSLGNFNKPTKYLEILIRSGRCVIDYNSAVLWCFNNVRLKVDYNGNTKADKNTAEQKIDPVISMTMALGGCLSEGGIDVEIV
jgi:phage terminase large subunit-like protein